MFCCYSSILLSNSIKVLPNILGSEVWNKIGIVSPPDLYFQILDIMSAEVIHTGGCHRKSVRWQVEAPASVVAFECNCSYCSMRGTWGFSVSPSKFKIIGDSNNFISTYSFNTHTARHTFCKVCGITSFYTPRSDPPGKAVTVVVSCVDPGTISHVEIRHFDGRDFEKAYEHLLKEN